MSETDANFRRKCTCDGCQEVRKALFLLDEIANSPATMSLEDIERLCDAREVLAKEVGYSYDEETGRYK